MEFIIQCFLVYAYSRCQLFILAFFDNSLLRLVIDRCIIFRILISTDKTQIMIMRKT